jgi:RNA polymerase sigma factor (sigma-70 family)
VRLAPPRTFFGHVLYKCYKTSDWPFTAPAAAVNLALVGGWRAACGGGSCANSRPRGELWITRRGERLQSTVGPEIDAITDPESPGGKSRTAVIERLFREHNEALIRFLRGRVGSRNEALEVAQEAYVRLLSLDQPGAVSYLRAFLFKTAANIAIDRRRRDRSYDKVTGGQLFTEFSENRTPERQLAAEQTLRHLGSLIESMPAKCQASFVMSQIHGLDAATIASQLGITDSMVRKYVVRALLHCREQMDLERND